MTHFKLLISFDGRLSVRNREAYDIDSAMRSIENDHPGETTVLVKVL